MSLVVGGGDGKTYDLLNSCKRLIVSAGRRALARDTDKAARGIFALAPTQSEQQQQQKQQQQQQQLQSVHSRYYCQCSELS